MSRCKMTADEILERLDTNVNDSNECSYDSNTFHNGNMVDKDYIQSEEDSPNSEEMFPLSTNHIM